MYNNTNTSTSQLDLTSISGNNVYYLTNNDQVKVVEHKEMSVLEAGHLLSIELKRQKIRSELEGLFLFKTKNNELDFLASHQDLRQLLPSIGDFFKKQFVEEMSFCLELMDEESNWQTLFINIGVSSSVNWQEANELVDSFFDNMFDLYPRVAEKLNIDFVANAI